MHLPPGRVALKIPFPTFPTFSSLLPRTQRTTQRTTTTHHTPPRFLLSPLTCELRVFARLAVHRELRRDDRVGQGRACAAAVLVSPVLRVLGLILEPTHATREGSEKEGGDSKRRKNEEESYSYEMTEEKITHRTTTQHHAHHPSSLSRISPGTDDRLHVRCLQVRA